MQHLKKIMTDFAELETVIKKDFMVKRSLMQHCSFSIGNQFKERWFVLTKNYFRYCLGTIQSGIGKTKGIIPLLSIQMVAGVYPEYFENRSRIFQVIYKEELTEEAETLNLYIQAAHDQMRCEWIDAIREACTQTGVILSTHYHVGGYLNGKYLCCQAASKQAQGCMVYESQNGLNIKTVCTTSDSTGDKDNDATEIIFSKCGVKCGVKCDVKCDVVKLCDAKFETNLTLPEVSMSSSQVKMINCCSEEIQNNSTVMAIQVARSQDISNSSTANTNVISFGKSLHGEKTSFSKSYTSERKICTTGENKIKPGSDCNAPRSPLQPPQKTSSMQVKALYDYQAKQADELCLLKGEVYDLLENSENWWKGKDKNGDVGYIPSSHVIYLNGKSDRTKKNLKQYEWYYQHTSRSLAIKLLLEDGREGCFMVRDSEKYGSYSLSLLNNSQVKHYHIIYDKDMYYVRAGSTFNTIPGLIEYYKQNTGLVTFLTFPPTLAVLTSLANETTEIRLAELTLLEDLWAGEDGKVIHGKYKDTIDVAIKIPRANFNPLTQFIAEAKILSHLQHDNLVQLIGVCTDTYPVYIVTEYLAHGSLLCFLRCQKEKILSDKLKLLDICGQVCKGMEYLEQNRLVHRDLAARNCLIGDNFSVKVADFGLARFLVNYEYRLSVASNLHVESSAPEVIQDNCFSTKADVWSFGVLMWEVFTGGEQPFHGIPKDQVTKFVCTEKGHLSQPVNCPEAVYNIMLNCWKMECRDRPMFAQLRKNLDFVCTTL